MKRLDWFKVFVSISIVAIWILCTMILIGLNLSLQATRQSHSQTVGSRTLTTSTHTTTSVSGKPITHVTPLPPAALTPPTIQASNQGAFLGGTVEGFAGKFGQPIAGGNGDYSWVDGTHTVITNETDPINRIEVVGPFTDNMDEQRACTIFFPSNPTFERESGTSYYFTTDAGEIVLTIGQNSCVLRFT